MVLLRVVPELRFLLPTRWRARGVVEVPYDETTTLGHMVQAAGIPLTEVGPLSIAGDRVDPRHRPQPEDVVEVVTRPRPQPLDGPPTLLLDVHLGALARRLRLLGLDAAYRNDVDDDGLIDQARREDRLLLTQDRGLLRRRVLRRAAYVHGSRPEDQTADVLDRFRLPLAPYTRCTACGGLVERVAKADVVDRLEPGTRRSQNDFSRCRDCGQVYWRGAHAARLEQLVSRHTSSEPAAHGADSDR